MIREDFISVENSDGGDCDGRVVRFGEVIVEILVKYAPNELATLVLQLPTFMNYIGAHLFELIQKFPEKSPEDVLCLVLYLAKRNELTQAKAMLAELSHENLQRTLRRHYCILFDVSTNAKGGRVVNFSDFAEIFFLNATHSSQQKLFIDVCLHVLSETQFIDYEAMLKLFMDYLSALIGGKSYINGQNLVQDFLEKYFHHINVKRHLVCFKSGEDYTSMDIFSSNSEPTSLTSNSQDTDNSIRKSVRILIRLYLTHLKYAAKLNIRHNEPLDADSEAYLKLYDEKIDGFFLRYKNVSSKIEEIAASKQILFHDRRHHYLNLMPPFEVNLLTVDATEEPSQIRMEQEVYVNLLKLQAILCNQEISSDIYKDVAQFLQANSEIVAAEAILSCIYPTNVGVEFVLDKCPQAVLEYGINKFKTDVDWANLLKSIQAKINLLDETNSVPELLLYYRIFRGEFLVRTLIYLF